ncbi:MAG: ORF6N domain-containing protein, partial [Elusimicrobiota bacterium]|nr:ORF6N domain-containing protein [Elusimicrobiota bacterium]
MAKQQNNLRGCAIHLEKQVMAAVLKNIKAAYANLRTYIPETIKTFRQDTGKELSLKNYLEVHAIEPERLLSDRTWTQWKAAAGLVPAPADPDLEILGAAVARVCQITAPGYLNRINSLPASGLSLAGEDSAIVALVCYAIYAARGIMSKEIIPHELIESKILVVRGHRVMLDRDLAVLYSVETKALNQAVTRNKVRFPADFMFQLTPAEVKNWKSQFVTSNSRLKMGLRKRPYAFTENGVAMLSSVLKSLRAVEVNIQIMRAFTKLRELLNTHADLRRKLEDMEKKYDYQFKVVFDAMKSLIADPPTVKKIGFTAKH